MGTETELDPLVEHVARTCSLSNAEALRIVDEVVSWFREEPDEFVRRRHRELQGDGVPNAVAYELLAQELARRPVPGPRLSSRQIRRIIYS